MSNNPEQIAKQKTKNKSAINKQLIINILENRYKIGKVELLLLSQTEV